MIVADLTPGDLIGNSGMSALYVAQAQHPIWPRLQLVIWRLSDGTWSFDALDSRQEVGERLSLHEPALAAASNGSARRFSAVAAMADLPEYVYLVTVDGEWPVSAIADDHSTTVERVEAEVSRRTSRATPPRSTTHAHVWRARLGDAVELELIPARTVGPSLRVRQP